MVPVVFDSSMKEIAQMPFAVFDAEIGDASTKNDIELTSVVPADTYGIAILGTDIGCIFEYIDAVSGETPTLRGWTWDGLLTQIVLMPPSGSDYLIIENMELNAAIRKVLSGKLGGFFTVPDTDSGITVESYQFELYTDGLTGLMAMCVSVGAKLDIHAEKDDDLKEIIVYIEGTAIVTYEETFNEDSQLQLEFIQDRMKYTHMICMGSGELQNRVKYEIYLQEDGTFSEKKPYTGFLDREYYYDDKNSTTHTALKANALKKFPDICWTTKMKINKAPSNMQIGDIAKGNHTIKDIYGNTVSTISVQSTVNKKIVKVSGGRMTVNYYVKDTK